MKIEACDICGEYHSYGECEISADIGDMKLEKFEKIKRQNNPEIARKERDRKGFNRPPIDKSLKWEYVK